jgi:hypothetical protein
MALRYLLDENQRGLLWRALQRHNTRVLDPVDVVRVEDHPDLPLGSTDPEILVWAEREGRILVSYDKATLAGHLNDHLSAGHHSPGVFLIRRNSTLSQLVLFLVLAAYASDPLEWQDRIEFMS